jgi:hypothetical protein
MTLEFAASAEQGSAQSLSYGTGSSDSPSYFAPTELAQPQTLSPLDLDESCSLEIAPWPSFLPLRIP